MRSSKSNKSFTQTSSPNFLKHSPTSHSDLHEISINALGGLGDGIADYNGKPLFIEKAAAGDHLHVRIINETKETARGEIAEILQGGPDRTPAPCPHFSNCGGCSLQQLKEDSYREFKHRIFKDTLTHAGFPNTHGELTFLPAASRRRVEFKLHHGDDGISFAFYAPRSRDLVPVDSCLILEPALQKLMKPLAEKLSDWYAVKAIKTLSLTMADSGIDMVLSCSSIPDNTNDLGVLAESLNIGRISLLAPGEKMFVASNNSPITMALGGYDIPLPAGAFLQASKEGQRLLTEAVIKGVGSITSVVDLFCGIGTYSFPLSKTAKVHAVENSPHMIKGLKASIALHGLTGHLSAKQRDLFISPLLPKELGRYKAAIINPPRPGAKKQCEEIAKSSIDRVVMVSCNPASFARDAKTLGKAGFNLESALAVDQFVYSPHLEIVATFQR